MPRQGSAIRYSAVQRHKPVHNHQTHPIRPSAKCQREDRGKEVLHTSAATLSSLSRMAASSSDCDTIWSVEQNTEASVQSSLFCNASNELYPITTIHRMMAFPLALALQETARGAHTRASHSTLLCENVSWFAIPSTSVRAVGKCSVLRYLDGVLEVLGWPLVGRVFRLLW